MLSPSDWYVHTSLYTALDSSGLYVYILSVIMIIINIIYDTFETQLETDPSHGQAARKLPEHTTVCLLRFRPVLLPAPDPSTPSRSVDPGTTPCISRPPLLRTRATYIPCTLPVLGTELACSVIVHYRVRSLCTHSPGYYLTYT
jgi:hypothetical protein